LDIDTEIREDIAGYTESVFIGSGIIDIKEDFDTKTMNWRNW